MGAMVELNTMLGLPDDFDVSTLAVGKSYKIIKERDRVFPLNIAVLIVSKGWNIYGYCRVNSSFIKDHVTELEFEVLTLFNEDEQKLYKEKFIEAGKITGEAQ